MITAHSIANKFIGVAEVKGLVDNPMIMEWLKLDQEWPSHDEVPWCSAFVNWVCHLCDLPRPGGLRARAWLEIGEPITIKHAKPGFDIVVLSRGPYPQPGPGVINAPGHVGFFDRLEHGAVWILGGNQDNKVCRQPYQLYKVLGARRLQWIP